MCLGLCCSAACCACTTCCKCLPTSKSSKLIYILIMLFATVLGLVLRYWGDELVFKFFSFQAGCTDDRCIGIQGVYRISFALAVFFLGMTILTAFAPVLHRGGWGIKFLVFIVFVVIAFLIGNTFYADAYSWVSRVGSVVFLVLQMLLLLDFFLDLHEYLTARMTTRDEEVVASGYETPGLCQNKWKLLYLLLSVAALVGSLVAIGVFYDLFDGCGKSKAYISIILIAGVANVVLCLAPKIGKGLLPGAMLFGYSTFLLWGALTSEPDAKCNDFANDDDVGRVIVGIIITALSVAWASTRSASSAHGLFFIGEVKGQPVPTSSSAASDEEAAKRRLDAHMTGANPVRGEEALTGEAKPSAPAPAPAATAPYVDSDDEDKPEVDKTPVDRRAWVFHLVMFFGALYMGMLLTNWGSLEPDSNPGANPEASDTSVWVKLVSAWLTNLLFAWILLAPMCCPGRDFSSRSEDNQFMTK